MRPADSAVDSGAVHATAQAAYPDLQVAEFVGFHANQKVVFQV